MENGIGLIVIQYRQVDYVAIHLMIFDDTYHVTAILNYKRTLP